MVKKHNATEIKQEKATYLLYANPGVGKTYALGYLPGKPLILDIDNHLPHCQNILIKKILIFGNLILRTCGKNG